MLARVSACGAGPASGRLNTEDDVDLRQAGERAVGVDGYTFLDHQEPLPRQARCHPGFLICRV